MKKILIALTALCCIMSHATAQTIWEPSHELKGGFQTIPAEFMKNGKAAILQSEDGNSVKVLDGEFNEIASFRLTGVPYKTNYKVVYDSGEVYDAVQKYDLDFRTLRVDYSEVYIGSEEINVTQSLFNDDDKFEYIIAIGDTKETVRKDEGYTQYRYTYHRTGYRVMNEDGEVLFQINAPANFEMNSYPELTIVGGNGYLKCYMMEISDEDKEHYDTKVYLYTIDRKTSSVKFVAESRVSSKVFPTLSDGAEPVVVALDAPTECALDVTVTSVNGMRMARTVIPAGASGTQIDTSAFPKGMYIVNVGKDEYSKIIIR